LIECYRGIRARLSGTVKPVVRTDLCRPKDKRKVYTPPVYTTYRTPGQQIIDRILQEKQVYWRDVFNPSKQAKLSQIRCEIWWILRQHGYTLQEIGKMVRPEQPYDHSTILHGIQRHELRLEKEHERRASACTP
jgi:hypothetical protein